ncbi:N-acetyltransferase [Tamlana fucoidanivorans]|uniref:N-acetyltransferase family protein n=1 Tax=Allotamlana fucoidanivorans TaxID=2583814 RepID=A0A5C4SMI0_9FLAO|nr:GNAT family N-acetyltransferase [Tamlana fucoidanivorans]TNJ44583.1 N-acetyltransferase family protein [Tamlana fucoidanivorans]
MIRSLQAKDTQQLLEIYNYYVLNTAITFDIEPLSLNIFEEKITRINNEYPFFVYEEKDKILGYAYASRFRPKPAYSNTVESTVYVKHGEQGKHIGTKLYTELLEAIRQTNAHTVLGVLTIPNDSSVKLHEKFGFTQVASLKEVGQKFGTWQNVGIWQLILSI